MFDTFVAVQVPVAKVLAQDEPGLRLYGNMGSSLGGFEGNEDAAEEPLVDEDSGGKTATSSDEGCSTCECAVDASAEGTGGAGDSRSLESSMGPNLSHS